MRTVLQTSAWNGNSRPEACSSGGSAVAGFSRRSVRPGAARRWALPKGWIDAGETAGCRRRSVRSTRRPGLHARLDRKLADIKYTYTRSDGTRSSRSSASTSSATGAAGSGDPARDGGRGRRGTLAAARGGAAVARLRRRARRGRKALEALASDARLARPRSIVAPARRGHVRPQLLLAARRRPAAHPAQDCHDPARRQVGEVQEGDDRDRARRRPLRTAREGVRRGDRQGRGEGAPRAVAPRDRARQPRDPPAPTRWRASSASSTTARSPRTRR